MTNSTHWNPEDELAELDAAADEFGEELIREEMAMAGCTRADAIRRLIDRKAATESPDPPAEDEDEDRPAD